MNMCTTSIQCVNRSVTCPPPKSRYARQFQYCCGSQSRHFRRPRKCAQSRSCRLRLQRSGRLAQVVAVAVPPGARQRDLADLAGIEVLALGLEVVLAGALLHAHLADAIVDARRLHHRRPLFDLEASAASPRNTSLPALSASMAIGTCQWSGAPISTTSISLILQQRAVVVERSRVGRALAWPARPGWPRCRTAPPPPPRRPLGN